MPTGTFVPTKWKDVPANLEFRAWTIMSSLCVLNVNRPVFLIVIIYPLVISAHLPCIGISSSGRLYIIWTWQVGSIAREPNIGKYFICMFASQHASLGWLWCPTSCSGWFGKQRRRAATDADTETAIKQEWYKGVFDGKNPCTVPV